MVEHFHAMGQSAAGLWVMWCGLILTSGHGKHRLIDGTMHRRGTRNLLRFDVLLAVFFLAFTYHVYFTILYASCVSGICVAGLTVCFGLPRAVNLLCLGAVQYTF
jgi:hypothetical protein